MSGMLFNRKRVIVQSETTEGTDQIALTLADATADIVYQQMRSSKVDPQQVVFPVTRETATNGGSPHVVFGDRANVSLEFPLTGKRASGAGNEEPYYEAILKAAGFAVAIVSDTSSTYTLATPQQASLTIYQYRRASDSANWRLWIATGVRGTMTFNYEVNTEAYATFEGFGQYEGMVTDEYAFFDADNEIAYEKDGTTAITPRTSGTETQANKSAIGCKNMTITLGGTTYYINKLSHALMRSVDAKEDTTGSSTVQAARLSMANGARQEGSFNTADLGTMNAIRDAISAGTVATLSITLTDGTNTSVTTFKVQLGLWSEEQKGNHLQHSVPFFVVADRSGLDGEGEMTLVET